MAQAHCIIRKVVSPWGNPTESYCRHFFKNTLEGSSRDARGLKRIHLVWEQLCNLDSHLLFPIPNLTKKKKKSMCKIILHVVDLVLTVQTRFKTSLCDFLFLCFLIFLPLRVSIVWFSTACEGEIRLSQGGCRLLLMSEWHYRLVSSIFLFLLPEDGDSFEATGFDTHHPSAWLPAEDFPTSSSDLLSVFSSLAACTCNSLTNVAQLCKISVICSQQCESVKA